MTSDETTSDGCAKLAFQAILRGDTAERDRLCERSRELIAAEGRAAAMEHVLSVDFYVTRGGVCIPTIKMAKAARAIQ